MTQPLCKGLYCKGLCLVALLLTGCAAGTGDVSGVVLYRGQPLPSGTISFFDETRGVWSSGIGPDGTYSVDGIPTGTARITVTTPMPITLPGAPPPPKSVAIPPKYADAQKSGLTHLVVRGAQSREINLTD
jgi:hypothetical protein